MKNITFIIFGASGDLTKRKIIPALYHLIARQKIEQFIIVGAAIDDTSIETIFNNARQHISQCDDTILKKICSQSFYKKVNFTIEQDFVALRDYTEMLEGQYELTGNRLFYCATAPSFFCTITNTIARTGLAKRYNEHDAQWNRIVYEKPFGHDLQSAHKINECIKNYFNESQIYRIDHYLTKDVVSNISMIRFTNTVLEPLWSHMYIDQVQIILSETIGIESRGEYYDHFGALRDMVQNHILELIALICMEAPEKLTGDFIRVERAKIIKNIQFIDGILGQYEGYTKEKNVNPHSQTETYATLALMVDTPRWKNVPFYVKTGKYLGKKETAIYIKFKPAHCLLLEGCPTEANWLTLKITPEPSFALTLNAKHPIHNKLLPVDMEFCYSCLFGLQTPESYEVIITEVIKGEQSVSVRFDEIEYAWKLIETIKKRNLPIFPYSRASSGPEKEEDFKKTYSIRWRE